jgi:hypothetical protein
MFQTANDTVELSKEAPDIHKAKHTLDSIESRLDLLLQEKLKMLV